MRNNSNRSPHIQPSWQPLRSHIIQVILFPPSLPALLLMIFEVVARVAVGVFFLGGVGLREGRTLLWRTNCSKLMDVRVYALNSEATPPPTSIWTQMFVRFGGVFGGPFEWRFVRRRRCVDACDGYASPMYNFWYI